MFSSMTILFYLGIIVFTIIMLSIVYTDIIHRNVFPKSYVCLTEDCMVVNSLYNKYVDKRFDPCKDFEKFACSTYVNKLKKEGKYGSGLEDSTFRAFARLSQLLDKPELKSDRLLARLTKVFYQSCMNPEVDTNKNEYVLRQINKIRPVPLIDPDDELTDWIDFYKMVIRVGLEVSSLLYITLEIPEGNYKDIYPMITRGGLRKLEDEDREGRKNLLIDILTKMGFEKSDKMEQDLDEQMDLQNELVDLIRSSGNTVLSDIATIGALKDKCQNVDWIKLLNVLYEPYKELGDDTKIMVYDEKFVCEFYDKIAGKERVLVNHIFTHHLENSLRTIYKFIPASRMRPVSSRSAECSKIINTAFPFGSSYTYMIDKDKQLGIGARKEISGIINRQARWTAEWEVGNESATWLSHKTRTELVRKIRGVVFHFGFLRYNQTIVEQIPEYEKIFKSTSLSKEDPLHNTVQINVAIRNRLAQVDRPAFINWLLLTPNRADSINANAWYIPNNILLTYALMAPLTYKHNGPSFHNYGGVGYIGSHEYGHVLDQANHKYNADNVLGDFWDEKSEKEYEERVKCLVDEYNKADEPCTGTKINGEKTAVENFADLFGIKLSRRMYDRWLLDHNFQDLILKDYTEYTPQQMYWIAASIVFCERRRKEDCESWNAYDPHTIGPVRLLMNLKLCRAFANDWRCRKNAPMNPAKRCEVF